MWQSELLFIRNHWGSSQSSGRVDHFEKNKKARQHSPKVLSGVIEMVYKLMTTELAKIHSSHHQLIIGCDCLISGRSNSVSFVRDCCLLGGHIVPVLFNHLLEICGAHCPCFIWRYAIPFWQIARHSCIVLIQFH